MAPRRVLQVELYKSAPRGSHYYTFMLVLIALLELCWIQGGQLAQGRCSLGETCDVMMGKSKYFHEFNLSNSEWGMLF